MYVCMYDVKIGLGTLNEDIATYLVQGESIRLLKVLENRPAEVVNCV